MFKEIGLALEILVVKTAVITGLTARLLMICEFTGISLGDSEKTSNQNYKAGGRSKPSRQFKCFSTKRCWYAWTKSPYKYSTDTLSWVKKFKSSTQTWIWTLKLWTFVRLRLENGLWRNKNGSQRNEFQHICIIKSLFMFNLHPSHFVFQIVNWD